VTFEIIFLLQTLLPATASTVMQNFAAAAAADL